MSQDYFSGEGSSSAGGSSSNKPPTDERRPDAPFSRYGPECMTVGTGPTSESATALMNTLNQDSGYGGSIAGDSQLEDWQAGLLEDRPTPTHTPSAPGEMNAAAQHEKQVVASHVHQLCYNSNRLKLGRAIARAVEILKEFQSMNSQWPALYPSFQPEQPSPSDRPVFSQTKSSTWDSESSIGMSPRPGGMRRAATSLDMETSAESSAAAERRESPAPRLVTQQIAQEFSILKLDLKLGSLSQSELVHSLEKGSIASLLDGKINQSIKHLLSLRERIEDTSSKVLITGDLNAGKSTFCNALLRRKVLPEDQQPCTSIFCEVLDSRENGGIEEVHAVHKDHHYNRNDESTYDVYKLEQLEDIVTDNAKYTQCKVYVKDTRTIDESLLNNGVVDISLIDAPGLNSDSLKTTAVFARQEEIDVVVFVLSAANHFTLSAKEFIYNAAHEKAYIFMVINGFDNIRDKKRCEQKILEQVAKLSPRTFKESSELVHFVSSNAIPVAPAAPGGGSDGGKGKGVASSDPSDDGPDYASDDDEPSGKPKDKGKGKEKEKEKIQDFENLEGALRRFVLEKRARSKLAPAKTYLLNVWSDLNTLASVNKDSAQSELDRVSEELKALEPAYENSKAQRTTVAEDLNKSIDETCDDVYDHTRSTLTSAISHVAEADLGVQYPGFLAAFQFAEDLKLAMLDQISASVTNCEHYARAKAVQGVNSIQSLGILHVGEDKFANINFRADMMFKRRRDALARQVNTEIELSDFFDIASLWERQEKVAGTGMAMTVVGVLGGRAFGGVGWIDGALGAVRVLGTNNMRRLMIPGIVAAALLTAAYLVSSIPTSLPPRLSRKLAATLSELDYTHSNASRISAEVRRVLRVPASTLQTSMQRSMEELGKRKDEVVKVKHESEVASKYFSNLFRESVENKRTVEQVDLDAPLPGGLSSYES
ncbi:mitofusin [Arachnomyces sp. PD_36]|nr:mitofusin [Arachnomyces sp. PD_36]